MSVRDSDDESWGPTGGDAGAFWLRSLSLVGIPAVISLGGFFLAGGVSFWGFFSKYLDIFGWDWAEAGGGEVAVLLCVEGVDAIVVCLRDPAARVLAKYIQNCVNGL